MTGLIKILTIIIFIIGIEIGAALINFGIFNTIEKQMKSVLILMIAGLIIVSFSAYSLFGIAGKNIFPRDKTVKNKIVQTVDIKTDKYIYNIPNKQIIQFKSNVINIQNPNDQNRKFSTRFNLRKKKRINKHDC